MAPIDNKAPVVVGISGGSGSVLAKRTIDKLLELGVPVVATCSSGALQTWQAEISVSFKDTLLEWQKNPLFSYYPIGDLGAPHGQWDFHYSRDDCCALLHGLFGSNCPWIREQPSAPGCGRVFEGGA